MKARLIIGEIDKKVERIRITDKPNLPLSKKYPYWYIGITDDADRRKEEHKSDGKDVTFWNSWPADTEAIARQVEKHFLDCGMDGGGGGGTNPNLVYIF